MSRDRAARAERLIGCVERFRRIRPIVLGDLVTDEFIYGDINRVSREAPVLILDETKRVIVPGGAANSVANLRALGARPIPVGIVGKDEAGKALLEEFKRRGIATSRIVRSSDYATPAKSRVLAGGVHTRRQQVVRIDRGQSRGELPSRLREQIERSFRTALESGEGLLVADYGYGVASPRAALRRRLRTLKKRGWTVTVDSRERVGQFEGITVCSPNQEELEGALGGGSLQDRQVADSGRQLLQQTGNDAVLVTRGANGMSLLTADGHERIEAWGSDEVADVTGAGDTVIATLTLASMAGASLDDASRLANYAAGIVVTKMGTATLTPEELIAAVEEDHRG